MPGNSRTLLGKKETMPISKFGLLLQIPKCTAILFILKLIEVRQIKGLSK